MMSKTARIVVLGTAVGVVLIGFAVPAAQAAPRCFGKVADYVGTNGRNIVRGSSGNDSIAGLGGNDVVVGRGGKDRICGNSGNDVLRGQGKNDRLAGGPGNDVHTGGGGNDTILGGPGDDRLLDQAGNDLLIGGSGNDEFDPRAGDDRMFGGSGNDTLVGGLGNDTYDGGDGFDLASFLQSTAGVDASLATGVASGEGSDSLTAIEHLEGTEFADKLVGDANANRLFGRAGDDCDSTDPGCPNGGLGFGLYGGAGNDELYGEDGDDDLRGEDGDDLLDGAEGAEDNGGDLVDGGNGNDRCLNGEFIFACEATVRSGGAVEAARRR
jgi:Ca2+-binding RTX toxin-like protein